MLRAPVGRWSAFTRAWRLGAWLACAGVAAGCATAERAARIGSGSAGSRPVASAAAPASRPAPGNVLRDCADCPEVVVIPPGRFRMGADGGEKDRYEGPVHDVTIGRAFAAGRTEVTVAQYRRFVTESGYPTTPGCAVWDGEKGYLAPQFDWRDPGLGRAPLDDEPVICLSWNDAHAYAAWLAQRTGQPYRLLSEAEWEYLARPSPQLDTPWGKDEARACEFANVLDRSGDPQGKAPVPVAACSDGYPMLAPVGRFPANGYGLYDVLGNVWEWVEDCYVMPYPATPADGSAQVTAGCDRRAVRGGSYMTRPDRHRVTFRGRDPAKVQSQVFGFRIARSLQ